MNSCVVLLAVLSLGAAPDAGEMKPKELSGVWPVKAGRAKLSIVDGMWLVRAPQQFTRGLDFGRRPKTVGQRG